MTREEFIKVLEEKGYPFKEEGGKIIVTYSVDYGYVNLSHLPSIPPGVIFDNTGSVNLEGIDIIPEGTVFTNGGEVFLDGLETISSGVVFNNRKFIYLPSVKSISSGIEFNSYGDIYLKSLIGGEGWFYRWEGNIKGIDPKRLLNKMIEDGTFDRR